MGEVSAFASKNNEKAPETEAVATTNSKKAPRLSSRGHRKTRYARLPKSRSFHSRDTRCALHSLRSLQCLLTGRGRSASRLTSSAFLDSLAPFSPLAGGFTAGLYPGGSAARLPAWKATLGGTERGRSLAPSRAT